jgi:hypothetical protein
VPDDERKSPEDRFRPDAIAARIDKLGTETEAERVEREEEQKLLERKKERRKSALETAASKRLSKIGEGNVKRPSVATGAVAEAVPLLERAARANKWIQEHRGTFGAIAAAALLCVGGALSWVFWQDKRTTEASVLLAQGLADEHGHVTATAGNDDTPTTELYPTFKSDVERRDAALAKYRSIESKYQGTGAAILARLSEASLLLDAGDAKGAIVAYEEVKGSALARADAEVRGRAIEGIGFGDELLAQSDGANRDKHLGEALAEFEALEAVDVDGFKELGMYHQARVRLAKDDKAAALDLLKKLHERMDSPGEVTKFSYLQFVVEDRLRELDPTALPPKPPPTAMMGGRPGQTGGGSSVDVNDPRFQELLRRLQQQNGQSGGPSAPAQPGSKP